MCRNSSTAEPASAALAFDLGLDQTTPRKGGRRYYGGLAIIPVFAAIATWIGISWSPPLGEDAVRA
jgi:hypothetical protein